jgi:hypothetical protein
MSSIKASGNDEGSENSSSVVENADDKKIVGVMKSKYNSSQMQHSEASKKVMDPMRGKSPQSSLSTANVYQH